MTREATTPLPMSVHEKLGAVDEAAHLAIVACSDRAAIKHSERVRRIRVRLDELRAAIDAAQMAVDEFVVTAEPSTHAALDAVNALRLEGVW